MKLGLGTVQFGQHYGISNQTGQTSLAEARKIIEVAVKAGVRVIDTAALYGDSEKVISQVLPARHSFRIVTKTPKGTDVTIFGEAFKKSFTTLKQSSLYSLMFHDAESLLSSVGDTLMKWAQHLKSEGVIQKVGVSFYDSKEIDAVLSRHKLDLVQVPLNILDQRLIQSGHLRRLKEAGVEIHTHSAFLQGLLLMNPDTLGAQFNSVKPTLVKLRKFNQERGLTATASALGFSAGVKRVDTVICGVNTAAQFEELCRDIQTPLATELFSEFAISDPEVLNPARWKL